MVGVRAQAGPHVARLEEHQGRARFTAPRLARADLISDDLTRRERHGPAIRRPSRRHHTLPRTAAVPPHARLRHRPMFPTGARPERSRRMELEPRCSAAR